MLRVIECRQVHQRQIGMLELDQSCRKLRPVFVSGDGFVDSVRVRAEVLLESVQQAWGGHDAEQLAVIRRSGSPILWQVPIDARRDRHWPMYVGGGQMRRMGDVPESWDLDVFRIPIPAALVLSQRVERGVGVNSVCGW